MNKAGRYKIQETSDKIQDTRFRKQELRQNGERGESEKEFFTGNLHLRSSAFYLVPYLLFLVPFSSCYTFRDISIPAEVKTVKIFYIENKARYVNPQISPQLTDALTQKISNQTKLTRTTSDDANWQISGTITNYSVSFSAVSGKQNTQNNLTVGVHIRFRDNLKDKTDEFDVSRDFPFSANLTLTQAESGLQADIVKTISEEIFNHIFSNW